MKLVLAIVHDEDGNMVMSELNKNGYMVTKLATTGGFLKSGNMTLLVGTDEDNVQNVIDLIESQSARRKQIVSTPAAAMSLTNGFGGFPIEVEVGGATIFVLNIERFEKV